MTVQTELDIQLSFSPDLRDVGEGNPYDAEFKVFVQIGVGGGRDEAKSLVTLEELFDDWFADENDGREFWRTTQFAMERLLDAQLQKVRKRLIQSGQYPSQ